MGRLRVASLGARRRIEHGASPMAEELARATWLRRMAHEHQSSAVFSRLHPQLIEAEAPLEVKITVLESAIDELRHASLCAEVAAMLGGDPEVALELRTEPLPEHPVCTPRERALRNLVFASCLSETVAVALLAAEREHTEAEEIKVIVDRLFRDEIRHARIGWEYLAMTWPELDDEARRRTERYLPAALEHLERSMLAEMPLRPDHSPPELDAELRTLGVLPAPEARDLLYATMREVIAPQLEQHGVSISKWVTQKRSARSE